MFLKCLCGKTGSWASLPFLSLAPSQHEVIIFLHYRPGQKQQSQLPWTETSEALSHINLYLFLSPSFQAFCYRNRKLTVEERARLWKTSQGVWRSSKLILRLLWQVHGVAWPAQHWGKFLCRAAADRERQVRMQLELPSWKGMNGWIRAMVVEMEGRGDIKQIMIKEGIDY